MSEAFYVSAFFDRPQLLAVRLISAGGVGATFAQLRRPDVASGIGAFAPYLAVGLLGLVGTAFALSTCSPDTPKQGNLRPTIGNTVTTDVAGGQDWASHLANLADDCGPQRNDLTPYLVRTLLDVPRELARQGDPAGGWLKPRATPEDLQANARAIRLAQDLALAPDPGLALILDLPGPLGVAAAAGLAGFADPVFTHDSLPHPAGVVPAAETLAAVVYWRPQFVSSKALRTKTTIPMFVLEGARLNNYANEPERFDNRSLARLPTVGGLKELGIERILYLTPGGPERGAPVERDDLNELFATCGEAGIVVRKVAWESLANPETSAPTTVPTTAPTTAGQVATGHVWMFPQRTSDDRDRTLRRPTLFSGGARPYDGGASQHAAIINGLSVPPPPPPSSTSSSGGSWSRSFGSSHSS